VVIYDPYPGDTDDFFEGVLRPVDVKGDIRDFEHLIKTIDQYQVGGIIDAVQAYRGSECLSNPSDSFSTTVEGTLRVLEAARTKNLRLVSVST
jgi:nucleoside-diphosphate-sugar epimerase